MDPRLRPECTGLGPEGRDGWLAGYAPSAQGYAPRAQFENEGN